MTCGPPATKAPMRTTALLVWGVLALLAFAGFVALGNWQLERRVWKRDLIDRVEAHVHAPVADAAPVRAQWPSIVQSGQDYAYRRVTLDGEFLHPHTTLVQAATVLGRGWWVMTPLRTDDGSIVLINRGFVPQAQTEGPWRSQPQGRTSVTGLLRLSEPGGAFLRDNDPAAGRWFSRDVAAIAAHHGLELESVAPWFIDGQARPSPMSTANPTPQPQRLPDDMLPVGGLTVIAFANNHLVYALTWYGLALMVALAAAFLIREEWRLRHK